MVRPGRALSVQIGAPAFATNRRRLGAIPEIMPKYKESKRGRERDVCKEILRDWDVDGDGSVLVLWEQVVVQANPCPQQKGVDPRT